MLTNKNEVNFMEQKYDPKTHDKIFDNSYNAGTIDTFYNEPIVLNEFYRKSYLYGEYNSDDNHRHQKMLEDLYDKIQESEYKDIFNDKGILKKKILKSSITELLEFLLPILDEHIDYSFAEKFSALCDILDIKESIIYEHLPISYKDLALDELSGYTKLENRQINTRLF